MKHLSYLVMAIFVLSVGMLAGQGKASMGADKAKVAVLPFDAVKLTESFGKKESVTWDKNSVSHETRADAVFADENAIAAFAEAATQKVVGAFVLLKRFTVIERTAMDKIIKEQNFQMSDNTNSNSAVQIGNLLGAQFICQGQLQNVTASEVKDDKGNFKGYSGNVQMQIRIIDMSTGEITDTRDVKADCGTKIFGIPVCNESSQSKAAYGALNNASDKIFEWLKRAFPVEGDIYEIVKETKKDGATKVSITCGKDLGVSVGDNFKVYEIKEIEINGKTIKKTNNIGLLSVKGIEEDGVFSTCKVEEGGPDISSKFKSGAKLKVVSTKKK